MFMMNMNMLNVMKETNYRSFQCFKIEAMHPSVTHPSKSQRRRHCRRREEGSNHQIGIRCEKNGPKKSDGSGGLTLQIRVSLVNPIPF